MQLTPQLQHCGNRTQHSHLNLAANKSTRCRSQHEVTFRSLQQCRRQSLNPLQAVDYRIAAPPVKFDHSSTADDVRTHLTKLGWERAWIDGITERIIKMEFETSLTRVQDVVQLLEGLGIPTHWVCNLISRAPAVLSRDPQKQIQPVLEYIQARGVKSDAFLQLVKDYPRLLTFNVSSDGSCLELGPARAEVDVVEDPYRGRVANVSYWRAGAEFETAPVSPRRPGTD